MNLKLKVLEEPGKINEIEKQNENNVNNALNNVQIKRDFRTLIF